MFTGIVQAVGTIVADRASGTGRRIDIDAHALGLADVAVGDSVAIEGCCLTVIAIDNDMLSFDVSAETLSCTAGFTAGGVVNLEKSLRLADRLGGHLVQGHVDGVGTVAAFAPVVGDEGRNWRLDVDVPHALARFVAPKGSIAINGVSLTVNGVRDTRFDVNLIPHTLAVTTLYTLRPGARVNLEADLMARYAARLLEMNEAPVRS